MTSTAPAANAGRTVLVRMRALVPELTPAEQRVAAGFLADPAGTAALSIAELAAQSDTSTASVVRFSRRLGYDHYQDLRLDVTREATRETSRPPACRRSPVTSTATTRSRTSSPRCRWPRRSRSPTRCPRSTSTR